MLGLPYNKDLVQLGWDEDASGGDPHESSQENRTTEYKASSKTIWKTFLTGTLCQAKPCQGVSAYKG